MRAFRQRFLAELRSACGKGFAHGGTRGFADVRITRDLLGGRPFTIYETQSTFDVNVIKTISLSFVVAGSMVTAMDLSTDRRQEGFGQVETDVADKNLWQRITPTAKLVNLGAILMLGLFYILPQRYVTKLVYFCPAMNNFIKHLKCSADKRTASNFFLQAIGFQGNENVPRANHMGPIRTGDESAEVPSVSACNQRLLGAATSSRAAVVPGTACAHALHDGHRTRDSV
mmetsp:Transcript_9510/g.41097  ORF Transcript_9510/g.41097 Transcript_9510/m.41097 type:complete len:229 (-) Transcript_9510:1376-2062(-)